jgi:hypothetical protein
VFAESYWTATADTVSTAQAWMLDFHDGSISFDDKTFHQTPATGVIAASK